VSAHERADTEMRSNSRCQFDPFPQSRATQSMQRVHDNGKAKPGVSRDRDPRTREGVQGPDPPQEAPQQPGR